MRTQRLGTGVERVTKSRHATPDGRLVIEHWRDRRWAYYRLTLWRLSILAYWNPEAFDVDVTWDRGGAR